MKNITIEVIMAYIKDDYEPTDSELLLLQDIVRDIKNIEQGLSWNYNRARFKEFDSVSIMEIFDYKIKIDPERLKKLTDKKRLFIDRSVKVYKQKF